MFSSIFRRLSDSLTLNPHDFRTGRVALFFLAVSFTFFGIRLFSVQQDLPYHPDEFQFVGYSTAYQHLLDGELRSPSWRGWSLLGQPLPSYLWGISLAASGVRDIPAYLSAAGFDGFEIWWNIETMARKANGTPGPPLAEPVAIARRGAYVVTLLLLASITLAAAAWGGYLTGIIALWIAAGNVLISPSSLRAMGDGPLLLFTVFTFFISLMLLKDAKEGRLRRAGAWCILGGITAALAFSSKSNGILSVVYFFPVAGYAAWRFRRQGSRWLAVAVPLSAMVSAVTVFFLSPYILPSPMEGISRLFLARMSLITLQQKFWPESALLMATDRTTAVWRRVLSFDASYGSLGVLGMLSWMAGVAVLGVTLIRGGWRRTLAAAFLFWAVVLGGVTTVLLPLDWDRYYLPIVVVSLLIEAYGISVCAGVLWRFVIRKGK